MSEVFLGQCLVTYDSNTPITKLKSQIYFLYDKIVIILL